MKTSLQGIAFDAYGTLFDVHSVMHQCEMTWPGHGAEVSRLWRTKQLEWTWQRSLMGRYADFREVTRAALHYSCSFLGLPCSAGAAGRLMKAYLRLEPFPDVAETLQTLQHLPLLVLSNGSPDMLEPLVANTGLDRWLRHIVSVHPLRVYKPAPEVYQLLADRAGAPPNRLAFVTANCWDACGAQAFGLRAFWINREGRPVDDLGSPPHGVIRSLGELPKELGAGS